MNALDTNILVRFFIQNTHIKEDYEQHLIATKVLDQPCFISLTVILELVWVLKSHYKQPKDIIAQLLQFLCDINHITIEKQPLLEQALSYYLNGMDFADAVHLVQANHCHAFYAFDQKLIKKAKLLHLNNQVTAPTL